MHMYFFFFGKIVWMFHLAFIRKHLKTFMKIYHHSNCNRLVNTQINTVFGLYLKEFLLQLSKTLVSNSS